MKVMKTFITPLVLIVACGWLLHSAYVEVRNQAVDQVNSQQLVLAETAARGIESFFDHSTELLTHFANMDAIASFDERGRQLMQVLYETHATDIKGVTRVDASGRILYTVPETPGSAGADLSAQEHIQTITQTHRPVVSDVFDSVQGFAAVAIHVPVFERDTFRGSLGVLIPFDLMARKYLEQIQVGTDGYAWMLSRKGIELYCPVPGHSGNSVFDNCKDFPTILSMAREMVRGNRGTTTYLFDRVQGETVVSGTKLAAYVPVRVGDTFWSIVVATPEEEGLAIIQGFKNRWLLIIGLLMLGTIVWTGYAHRAFRILREEEKRKQAETALKASEEKYRELVENANSIIIRMDAEGRVTYFNEFAQRFFGFPEEEIVGRHVVGTIVPPTESSGRDMAALIEEIVHNPDAFANNENENMRRNGERVWIAWTNKPVFDENGRIREVLCVGNDLTDRKRAGQALRESEALLSEAQRIAHIGSWRLDVSDNRLTWSDEVYRIFGFEPQEFDATYEAFLDAVHPEDRDAVDAAYSNSLREGQPSYEIEHRVVRKHTGEIRQVREKCVHFRDESGTVLRSVGMVQDITDSKRGDEEKALLQAQLIQAQKMESVGRLAGGVAHDFNNKIQAILGYASLSLSEIQPGRAVGHWLLEIQKAAQQSADLTRQLLAFARKQTVRLKVIDLNDTVSGMLNMLRRIVGEDIELNWTSGRGLWSVNMDPAQIDQILINLVVNSRDAISGPGTIALKTENHSMGAPFCAAHPGSVPGDYVLLTVRDNGCGMGKEILKNIFEPFFTTKELGKGTGLGLATVYGIVKQNHGYIDVQSEPDQGTTFSIYLPRFDGNVVGPGTEPMPDQLSQGTETVLIVEDEETVLSLGRTILQRQGYRVLTASAPREAIRLVEEYEGVIHLLITDVVMPEMNGRDLAERLGLLKPDLKCLFMSGYTADVIAHHGVLDATVRFIQKPFTLKELTKTVREILEG